VGIMAMQSTRENEENLDATQLGCVLKAGKTDVSRART